MAQASFTSPTPVNDDAHAHCPRLAPAIHPYVEKVLGNTSLLHNLVDAFGSPLNLVFPEIIDENIQDFKAVYKQHHLRGRIYFTSKPCKSRAIVRRASLHDIGIDVSSVKSLHHVLAGGFSPDRIEATGPKNADYILTCLQLDVLLNVDSFDELKSIIAFHKKLNLSRKARIMVRLCGFSSTHMTFTPQDHTFGIHTKYIAEVFAFLQTHKDILDFKGFSFHSSHKNALFRLVAIETLLQLTFEAIKKGLKPTTIDIGGSFNIQYAADRDEWAAYTESLKKSVLGTIPPQVWNNGNLGLTLDNGVVAGAPLYGDHYPPLTKGRELSHWLSQRSSLFGNETLASIMSDSLIELAIEPGRGLLDQCGITLGRVVWVKESEQGETLVGLEMNRSNNHAVHIKDLTTPIIIPRTPRAINPYTKGVYYIGNLCLSYDVLKYNKTYPPFLPQSGDLVAFVNTAAYMMDFVESETLMQPVAKKIAVHGEGMDWAQDEHYLPIDVRG